MFGVIMPLCNRMACCIFGWYFFTKIRLKYEKIILLSSARAFLLSTPVENSEATWKKATKCNKNLFWNYLTINTKIFQHFDHNILLIVVCPWMQTEKTSMLMVISVINPQYILKFGQSEMDTKIWNNLPLDLTFTK